VVEHQRGALPQAAERVERMVHAPVDELPRRRRVAQPAATSTWAATCEMPSTSLNRSAAEKS
jgi:hypothetical protein